jgi:hypothetical protein
MPPTPDLRKLIRKIPEHSELLPLESTSPIEHYRRGANDAYNLLQYFNRLATGKNVYAGPKQRHQRHLSALTLVALVESFERFLKELAAVCVDHLASITLDDRLACLAVNPRSVAAHFDEETLGKALCEANVWLDAVSITNRFGKLLASHFQNPSFQFFPAPSKDKHQWRGDTMDLLFQLRHSIVHNVGVITRSDALKLRLMCQRAIDAPRVLTPSNSDVRYAKLFLDETALWGNDRVADRLAEVLSERHADDATLFDPTAKAAELTRLFRKTITVASQTASP